LLLVGLRTVYLGNFVHVVLHAHQINRILLFTSLHSCFRSIHLRLISHSFCGCRFHGLAIEFTRDYIIRDTLCYLVLNNRNIRKSWMLLILHTLELLILLKFEHGVWSIFLVFGHKRRLTNHAIAYRRWLWVICFVNSHYRINFLHFTTLISNNFGSIVINSCMWNRIFQLHVARSACI